MSSYIYPPSGGSGSPYFGDAVASIAALPPSGVVIGEIRLVLDENALYEWNGAAWVPITDPDADVKGPASAVADHIAVFNGVTGKIIKDGGTTIATLVTATQTAQNAADAAQADATQALSDAAAAQADATQALSDAAAAQADATQALSDAAAAQADATQALSDAAAAQSTANGAQTDATQALSDAAAAQSDANAAQADATQALSDAAGAQADATQALSDAAAAQSTANDAQADATQALLDAADAQTDATQALADAAAKLCATSVATVNSNVTLTNKRIHFVDTSSARSLTLPSPSVGSFIVVKDSTGSCSTNNITILRAASEKIETVAASYVLNYDLGSWTFVSDGTDWFII